MRKLKIVVSLAGGQYYASRIFPPSATPFPNAVFEREKDFVHESDFDRTLAELEVEVRDEARRLGITKVVNLDPD